MEPQDKIWDRIAKEWNEFKTKPGIQTLEFIKKQKGKILDLGSGSGRYLIKKSGLKFYLVDFSKEMIKLAKQKAKKLEIEAEFFISESDNLPFKDNFFDSAICTAAIHCIPTEKARENSIREIFRVLKPGAKTKIAVWNKNSKRFKNSPKERFVRWRDKGSRYYYLYEPEEIYKDFEKVGFKITKKFPLDLSIAFIAEKPEI